jgi:erythronate-4-phosphate dehydrogenase
MQYLASSLVYLQKKYNLYPDSLTLGIIGAGNVGSKVASMASTLGYKVLLNDPPREEKEGSTAFTALETLLKESDIISLHVPLEKISRYSTYNMVENNFLNKMKTGSILINTSRGQVIDETELKKSLRNNKLKACVLDVWDSEPAIDTELLEMIDLGTAHIAGYSADGKAKGTSMIIESLARYYNFPLKAWKPIDIPAPEEELIEPGSVEDAILKTYRVEEDSVLLKSRPGSFEELRGNYRMRREFGAYKVRTENKGLIKNLTDLGFKT